MKRFRTWEDPSFVFATPPGRKKNAGLGEPKNGPRASGPMSDRSSDRIAAAEEDHDRDDGHERHPPQDPDRDEGLVVGGEAQAAAALGDVAHLLQGAVELAGGDARPVLDARLDL